MFNEIYDVLGKELEKSKQLGTAEILPLYKECIH